MPPQSMTESPAASPPRHYSRPPPPKRNNSGNPDETRSIGSNLSSEAPRSVYLKSAHLTRELSDLSGSYANGSTRRGSKAGNNVPGDIYDQASAQGTWHQAYTLSTLPPKRHSKPHSAHSRISGRAAGVVDTTTIIMNHRDDGVELVEGMETMSATTGNSLESNTVGGLNLDKLMAQHQQQHNRIPVMILLMDGQRHSYELMQLWIDRFTDSVREVVQSVQQAVPEKWRQAYDGVFQVRGNRFTQLIHILRLGKYDIQPHEILIAKPWSMTAKVTIAYATSVIRHLTSVGVINTEHSDKSGRRVFRPKTEESPLLLSKTAQGRIFAPEGILSHHHAHQFVTFAPPFEMPVVTPTAEEDDDADSSLGSLYNSVGSHPFQDKILDAISETRATTSPKSITKTLVLDGANEKIPLDTPEDIHSAMSVLNGHLEPYRRNRVGWGLSKLNCCRSREEVGAQLAVEEAHASHMASMLKLNCCKTHDPCSFPRENISTSASNPQQQLAVTTLSLGSAGQELEWSSFEFDVYENAGRNSATSVQFQHREQAPESQQWSPSFDIRPISEEQSLTGTSVVSMSAPLLSTQPRGLRTRLSEF